MVCSISNLYYAPENDCRFTMVFCAYRYSATYTQRKEIKAAACFDPGSPAWEVGMSSFVYSFFYSMGMEPESCIILNIILPTGWAMFNDQSWSLVFFLESLTPNKIRGTKEWHFTSTFHHKKKMDAIWHFSLLFGMGPKSYY